MPDQRCQGSALSSTNMSNLSELHAPLPTVARELATPEMSIYSALFDNGQILGISCINPTPRVSPKRPLLPQSLCPTEIQLTIVHRPYIDCLPFPRLRDNLIISSGVLVNDEEFCADLVSVQGNFFQLGKGREGWDPAAWVMSSSFKKKWGFLFL